MFTMRTIIVEKSSLNIVNNDTKLLQEFIVKYSFMINMGSDIICLEFDLAYGKKCVLKKLRFDLLCWIVLYGCNGYFF